MTVKKFNQMTTKKLNALLATASDEDKAAIEAVLAARKQAQIPEVTEVTVDETPLTPEEEAAIKAAEENGGLNPLYNGSKTAQEKKKLKMTDEERHALAEELKANINHRCQVVPFNTVEWVGGYIAGVIEEKRSNKVLYAIKTDDGRRIVKVYDSNLLKVLDEVIVPEKKARTRKAKSTDVEKVEWTPEVIAEEINKVIDNVGKTAEIENRGIDENGEEHIKTISGRIVAIVPEKRTQHLLYRIIVSVPTETDPAATKIMHKVVTAEGLQIAEEFDAEGQELNTKYRNRREAVAARASLTPQDRVIYCEENLKKAEEKLQKATKELETKKKQLEEAKAELDAYLAAQVGEAPAEEAPAEEAPAEEADPLA